MYIYIDESGDLGFDFTKGGTTRFFVVTLLILNDHQSNRAMAKAVARTIKNKLRQGKQKKDGIHELKGAKTDISVKSYFFKQISKADFRIYSLVLNKARVFQELQNDKKRLYNFVARLLIQKCPFAEAKDKIILTLDKSKDQKEILEFNKYLLIQLQGVLPIKTPMEIYHLISHESAGIQAADLFSWGVFRKYERNDLMWYKIFKDKIKFETLYLP